MKQRFSELRRDAHHGGWVLLTNDPEREQLLNSRIEDWPLDYSKVFEKPEATGAVMLWNHSATLSNQEECRVRVIANRFPLYRVEGKGGREGYGIYDKMQGLGAHELVIESDKQEDTLLSMHTEHISFILRAYLDRLNDLHKDQRMRSFSIFREWFCGEKGKKIHPHSQIIANAIIPLTLKNELDAARDYYNFRETCIFCDMIRQENMDEERIVHVTDEFITYCPYASRFPFEVHLFPHHHDADFTVGGEKRLLDLAEMIKDTAYRLEQAIPDWRILMTIHTAPVYPPRMEYIATVPLDYHWHIEFLPIPPGFVDWYLRVGTYVETTPPEKAAAFLRDITPPSS